MNSAEILDLIDDIAQLPSRNDKEARLDGEITKCATLRQVLNLCYNTFITFGVTPPAKVKGTEGGPMFAEAAGEPWATLDLLERRKLTGNAAKDAVLALLTSLEPKSSQLLYRILMKDMRAGFGKNTVNRVLPGTIVTFNVMLSHHYEAKRVKEWPVPVEPKLDGLRAMSLVVDGQSKAFSRTGNHFPALDHLSDGIVAMVRAAWEKSKASLGPAIPGARETTLEQVFFKMLGGSAGPSLAIDSEAMAGGFNESSGAVRRKGVQADGMVLHIFDAIPYALMTGDEPEVKIPWKVRRLLVEYLVACAGPNAPFRVTQLDWAANDDEVQALFVKHRDTPVATYIANGDAEIEAALLLTILDKKTGGPKMLEGAMVKAPSGFYVKKKGHIWQKIKAEETEDLRITGWFEGEVGGRLQDKFAGFKVDREGVEVRVGGGFKHAELEEFHLDMTQPRDRQDHTGRLIEVEYHEVTPDGSLRHPRFVRFRDDKDENLRIAA